LKVFRLLVQERKKTYLELSSVQKQVIDLETKFEDYNDEIVSNKSRYDNILNSISKLEVRMDKISKKVQRISNNSHNVLLDSDVNKKSTTKKIKKQSVIKRSTVKKRKDSEDITKRALVFDVTDKENSQIIEEEVQGEEEVL